MPDIPKPENGLLTARREFFLEVDSLLSWLIHRDWKLTSKSDKDLAIRLQLKARSIYEETDPESLVLKSLTERASKMESLLRKIVASVDAAEISDCIK